MGWATVACCASALEGALADTGTSGGRGPSSKMDKQRANLFSSAGKHKRNLSAFDCDLKEGLKKNASLSVELRSAQQKKSFKNKNKSTNE